MRIFTMMAMILGLSINVIPATYYLTTTGAGSAQTATNWWTNQDGTGTQASSFAGNGDVFIIDAGTNGIVNGAWLFGSTGSGENVTLIVNGSLTINSGVSVTLRQRNTGVCTMTINGAISFNGTNSNQLVGSTNGNGTAANIIFNLSSGAFLKTANNNGILGASASINTTNLTANLNTGANYEFSGAAQNSIGLPTTVNNLTLSGSGAKTISGVTVNGILSMEGNGTVSISSPPAYGATATLQYKGSAAQTTGPEFLATMAAGLTVIIDNAAGVTLHAARTLNGELTFINGIFYADDFPLTLGTTALVNGESDDNYLVGELTITRNVGTGTSDFGGIGVEIIAGPDDLGNVTVIRNSGPDAVVTVEGESGIARRWEITSVNPPTNGRIFFLSWNGADANGIDPEEAVAYRSTDGNTWTNAGGQGSIDNSIEVSTNAFSHWTVSDDQNPLPVELTSFSAAAQKNNVVLNWKTATEVDNYGFDVEKKVKDNWEKIGFVEGHGNSNSIKSYTFSDQNVLAGKSYSYRLKQVDTDGDFEYSKSVEVTMEAPKQFNLMQNHPNPFNPVTTIVYSIPQAGNVSLKIYDVIGNQIAELVNEKQSEGSYEVSFNASNYPSGVYFYRLETSTFAAVKKMLLIK